MIEEIKEALEKATAGPWADNVFEPYTTVYSYDHLTEEPDGIIARCEHEEDAHLISNAPHYLRYLLDELEKAKIALYTHESYDRTVCEMHIENERLRTEHNAMKNYLMELRECTDSDMIRGQIGNVISTLRKEGSHE